MSSELAILVVSCDKYSDLWPIFFELKRRKWPDCKYKIYLGTNNLKTQIDGVKNICIGDDVSWAENVKKMLFNICEEYVLMLLEDFFIDRRIESTNIDGAWTFMARNNIDCLRLEPLPPPAKILDRKLQLGKLNPKAPYFVSTQPAIWKRDVLISLLREGYSAWDFEQKNSMIYANGCEYNFWGTKKYIFHHKNGVERGKYYTSTIKLLKKEKIQFDIVKRGAIKDNDIISKLKLCKYRFCMWLKRMEVEREQ